MIDETKKYVTLTSTEISQVLLSAAVIAFVMSFNDWGGDEFSLVAGVTSLVIIFITALALLLIRISVQKIYALRLGYFLTYQAHKWGTAISFFFSFIFLGTLFYIPVIPPYVTPGEVTCTASKRLKLGKLYYGLNYGDLAKTSIVGVLVVIVIMLILQPLFMLSQHPFVLDIIRTCAAISIGALIPLPGSDGFHIFYYRRWLWLLVMSFVIIFFVLAMAMQVYSIILSFVLALIVLVVFKRFA